MNKLICSLLLFFASLQVYGQISATWTVKDLTCYQDTSGAIYLTATGGVLPYTYNWTPPIQGPQILPDNDTLTNLWAGRYDVVIFDNVGASQSYTNINVSEPFPLSTNIATIDVICDNLGGGAEVYPSGGTPPYSYEWKNSIYSGNYSNQEFGLTADWLLFDLAWPPNSVTTTDSSGCRLIDTFYIDAFNEPWNNNLIVNYNYCNDSACLVPDLYQYYPPYIYSFDLNWGNNTYADTLCIRADTMSINYTVSVTDMYGCNYTAETMVSSGLPSINNASISQISSPCEDTVTLVADAQYGTPPFNYNWSNGAQTQSITNLTPGFYIVTITDNNSCSISVASTASITIYDPINPYFDLLTSFVVPRFIRPGQSFYISAAGYNRGCLPVSGTWYIVYDSALLSYNGASLSPDVIIGDTLGWHFTDLTYDSAIIRSNINFIVSPQATISQSAVFDVFITPINGDADSTNNWKRYTAEVRNSYDPNDKQVYPQRCSPNNYVLADERLTYTIRFQNTGNAPAIDVYLLDDIDNDLDLYSMQVLSTSHPNILQLELINNTVVKFNFPDIWLPDSLSDPEGSQGYVVYDILPNANTAPNTIIDNSADIYFDYNPPIITNNVRNTVVDSIPIYQTIIYADECTGITFNNQIINQSGIYTAHLFTNDGCDSIITVNLTINNITGSLITPVVCDSYTSPSGNYIWLNSGTFRDTIPNSVGCDSIIIFFLTINNNTSVINPVACDSYTSPSGNYIWTNSGTYMDTIPNVNGCDSTIVLNLTVLDSNLVSIQQTICEGESYLGYSLTGLYTDVYNKLNGCDSSVILNLTVLDSNLVSDKQLICEGESYMGYTQAGIYYNTYVKGNGCDSSVILSLTVYDSSLVTTQLTICEGESFLGHTQAGNYTVLYSKSNGCDSTVLLSLAVNNNAQSSSTLSLTQGDSAYLGGQWQTTTGTYYDTLLTTEGCDSVVATQLEVEVGINETLIPYFSIYPNPTTGMLTLKLTNGELKRASIAVSNILGEVISTHTLMYNKTYSFSIAAPAGLYFISLTTADGKLQVVKVIKE